MNRAHHRGSARRATSCSGKDQKYARACDREAGNADEGHLLEPRKRQQQQACVPEHCRTHAEKDWPADMGQRICRYPGPRGAKLIRIEVHGVVDRDADQARAENQCHEVQFTEGEVCGADSGRCAGTQGEQAERRSTPVAEQHQHQGKHCDGADGAEKCLP